MSDMNKLDMLIACLPEAPFKVSLKIEIETLRQRVAELEDTRAYENLIKYGNSSPEMYKTELDLVKEQLAAVEKERDDIWNLFQDAKPTYDDMKQQMLASQAREQQLRKTLSSISANRCYEGKVSWEDLYKRAATEASYALAIPNDTSALDALHSRKGEA